MGLNGRMAEAEVKDRNLRRLRRTKHAKMMIKVRGRVLMAESAQEPYLTPPLGGWMLRKEVVGVQLRSHQNLLIIE